MADLSDPDFCLRTNPQYQHLYSSKPAPASLGRNVVHWTKINDSTMRSVCGRYEVLKVQLGHTALYDVLRYEGTRTQVMRRGMKSFADAKRFVEYL